MQQNETMIAAKAIASELVADPCPRGVARLAEALAEPNTSELDAAMAEAAARVQRRRSEMLGKEIRDALYVSRLFRKSDFSSAGDWEVWSMSLAPITGRGKTLAAAEQDYIDKYAKAARAKAIAERVEREVREADAADAALRATAPLEYRPDGSGADSLPITSIGPSGIGGEYQSEVRP